MWPAVHYGTGEWPTLSIRTIGPTSDRRPRNQESLKPRSRNMAKKIPSRKFPKTKKKIASRKLSGSNSKLQSRGFDKRTAKIPSRKKSKASEGEHEEQDAAKASNALPKNEERKERLAALRQKIKSLKPASEIDSP